MVNRAFGYATSTDGINFIKNSNNPVFSYPAWANSATTFGEPMVYVPPGKEGKEMLITFDTAYANATGDRFISQALTVDGGATWHYRVGALLKGTGWESKQVFDSCIHQGAGNLYLLYGGADITGAALNLDIQIGIAYAPFPYTSLVSN